MAPNTGRTVSRYFEVWLDNAAGVLTQVKVDTIGDIGLDNPESDLTALLDAIRGVLLDTPSFATTIGGPLSTDTHTHLTGVAGRNTPLAGDFRLGINHVWEAGEPTFGITGSATNGFLLSNYKVTNNGTKWSANISVFAGSTAPEWNTVAHT